MTTLQFSNTHSLVYVPNNLITVIEDVPGDDTLSGGQFAPSSDIEAFFTDSDEQTCQVFVEHGRYGRQLLTGVIEVHINYEPGRVAIEPHGTWALADFTVIVATLVPKSDGQG